MRHSCRRRLGFALLVSALAGPACSDGYSTGSGTTIGDASTSSAPAALPQPTTAASTGDTALAPGSEVLRFDVPGDISCVPTTALIEVSYATRHLDAVGFAVDGRSVPASAAPPTSGTFVVPVPCDGNVHTIMLIGSGAGGPAFATKAVVTRPA